MIHKKITLEFDFSKGFDENVLYKDYIKKYCEDDVDILEVFMIFDYKLVPCSL